MRKRPLILSLILLLLIGGGGGAFYLHLRTQAPPKFSEVDAFLRNPSSFSGWTYEDGNERIFRSRFSSYRFPRLRHFGFTQKTIISTRIYQFYPDKNPVDPWMPIEVYFEDERIDRIFIGGGTHPEIERFKRTLLENFPNLRSVVRTNP